MLGKKSSGSSQMIQETGGEMGELFFYRATGKEQGLQMRTWSECTLRSFGLIDTGEPD